MLYNCQTLRINNLKEKVTLRGFVAKKRNLGNLVFVDLRDQDGITQIVFKNTFKDYELAQSLGNEDVIEIEGVVSEREAKNPNLLTGDIEVIAKKLIIYSKAKQTPLLIQDKTDALEDTRLKYRYLDLRRPIQKDFIIKRALITQAFRSSLIRHGFLELDTPLLGKSTPEGAREYLVPSRLYPGNFYALPQSPQVYKQLYMIAGFNKYFQIAKCLRDEDLRADRQPEFTQVDIEMSYPTEDSIFKLGEEIYKDVFKEVLNIDLKTPFKRIKYWDAIRDYGSDKPDLRFKNLLIDLTNFIKSSNIEFLKSHDCVTGVIFKDNKDLFTRKYFDNLFNEAKKFKATNINYVRNLGNEFQGSLAKFFTPELAKEVNLKKNEVLILIGGTYKVSKLAMGAVRNLVADSLGLKDMNKFEFLWLVDFPMFESDDEDEIHACHHPFTRPKGDLDTPDLLTLLSYAYDLVLNGFELASGSLRIYDQEMQAKMFKLLKMSEEDITNRFGFFIEALKYGVPPHGGIAFGLERTTMIMLKTNNIKDVVAFPKTQSAKDLMSDAPSKVNPQELNLLGIKVNE